VAGAFAEVHEQVPGLLRGPRSGGVGSDAQDVHEPGIDLHYEEDVQALEEHGVNMDEIARQDSGRLRLEELPPGWGRPAWCGPESRCGQDPADRSLADAVAEAEEFALDAPVPVGAENLRDQAIFVNHAPGAIAPLDPELIQIRDAVWQLP
jgi:hypothetical protein